MPELPDATSYSRMEIATGTHAAAWLSPRAAAGGNSAANNPCMVNVASIHIW